MLSRVLTVATCYLYALQLPVAQAQQMDMEAMMKWATADVVRYHIVGVYQGQTFIASNGSGQADVTDASR